VPWSHSLWCRHAKSKNIPCTTSPENASKRHQETPTTKTRVSEGGGPQFLRGMHFAKKHKKGLKKTQADNPRPSACAEVLQALIIPKGLANMRSQRCQVGAPVTCLHCPPRLGKWICAYGQRLQVRLPLSSSSSSCSGPGSSEGSKGAQAPVKTPW
jgi:hypothetical protein